MVFKETRAFERVINQQLTDEEYRLLQAYLAQHPASGVVIKGTGGLRKLRWSVAERGKRGGMRIIYYWVVSDSVILLLYAFPKNVQTDLTPAQRKLLVKVVREEYP